MAISNISTQQAVTFAWRHYYEMTKPKVVLLIAFTALVGMLLSREGLVPLQPLLFGLLGMMILVSAHSFLTLYLGLELLALSQYALVAFDRDSREASEAAMKYFVLGALASGMLLYGISMLRGDR